MTAHRKKWYLAMRKKLGVKTDKEVNSFMRSQANKATHPGTGGFAYMAKHNPEKLKLISSAAANKRHGN